MSARVSVHGLDRQWQCASTSPPGLSLTTVIFISPSSRWHRVKLLTPKRRRIITVGIVLISTVANLISIVTVITIVTWTTIVFIWEIIPIIQNVLFLFCGRATSTPTLPLVFCLGWGPQFFGDQNFLWGELDPCLLLLWDVYPADVIHQFIDVDGFLLLGNSPVFPLFRFLLSDLLQMFLVVKVWRFPLQKNWRHYDSWKDFRKHVWLCPQHVFCLPWGVGSRFLVEQYAIYLQGKRTKSLSNNIFFISTICAKNESRGTEIIYWNGGIFLPPLLG